MMRWLTLLPLLTTLSGTLSAYPLDGEDSGIRRLVGYLALQQQPATAKLPAGALLGVADIRLHLLHKPEWDLTPQQRDPDLQSALDKTFQNRDRSYGITLIDFTQPDQLRWAGLREDRAQAPGSVGKILCMLALFDGLQRAFPATAERERILREHIVAAEDWVISDQHKVPRLDPTLARLRYAIIQPGERYSLAEWLDHMISASANSAGSTIWKEAILLRVFGKDYPPTPMQETEFFRTTPRQAQAALAQAVINDALQAADLNPAHLKVGNFWTRVGKQRIPGPGGSTATPKELVRFLLRLEQGRLVDAWSSVEMKRYLYMTKRRYRYAFAPELAQAAVYFKSGSLYRCKTEEGYTCGKYLGNVENAMNSIAIIESPAQANTAQRRYMVALTSNVLRKNSAWDHSRIGAAIEALIRLGGPVNIQEHGSDKEIKASGSSD